ncbi:mitoferrin-1-like isoform X2 [Chiloscyllium plagiosum]|uniref:mitoferrin-1-like isoform X2 n=1 Tax=Chiloscyllium plagiosum TaxID=36176 RepID=UPI001CB7EA71|nr:mitoferrin-1-like isoform X2 [Chiloscyllium plagiosum]
MELGCVRAQPVLASRADEGAAAAACGPAPPGAGTLQEPEEDVYESLPASVSVSAHMMAGSLAGIMEHSIMFPIDSVKTRMQSLQPDPKAQYKNVFDGLLKIVHTEGFWRPFRGLNAMVLGAGPAHAMYFSSYEKMKRTLSDAIGQGGNSHLANGIAGGTATLIHDAVMTPAEAVKQRMQMFNSPYKGVLHCIRVVYKTEGIRAFYWSYTTQLTMNVPFQAIHFMTYEFMQEQLNPCRHFNPLSHMLSGALAGATAAAATTPLDVCKTLLNTQENLKLGMLKTKAFASPSQYSAEGVLHCQRCCLCNEATTTPSGGWKSWPCRRAGEFSWVLCPILITQLTSPG